MDKAKESTSRDVVSIDDATRDNNRYVCIECARPVEFCWGDKRKYFRHKDNSHRCWYGYLGGSAVSYSSIIRNNFSRFISWEGGDWAVVESRGIFEASCNLSLHHQAVVQHHKRINFVRGVETYLFHSERMMGMLVENRTRIFPNESYFLITKTNIEIPQSIGVRKLNEKQGFQAFSLRMPSVWDEQTRSWVSAKLGCHPSDEFLNTHSDSTNKIILPQGNHAFFFASIEENPLITHDARTLPSYLAGVPISAWFMVMLGTEGIVWEVTNTMGFDSKCINFIGKRKDMIDRNLYVCITSSDDISFESSSNFVYRDAAINAIVNASGQNVRLQFKMISGEQSSIATETQKSEKYRSKEEVLQEERAAIVILYKLLEIELVYEKRSHINSLKIPGLQAFRKELEARVIDLFVALDIELTDEQKKHIYTPDPDGLKKMQITLKNECNKYGYIAPYLGTRLFEVEKKMKEHEKYRIEELCGVWNIKMTVERAKHLDTLDLADLKNLRKAISENNDVPGWERSPKLLYSEGRFERHVTARLKSSVKAVLRLQP